MPDTENGRRTLWRAVIDQAFIDAIANAKTSTADYDRRSARLWLSRRSADLDEACELADREPDAVIREAAAIIAAHDKRVAAGLRRLTLAEMRADKPEPRPDAGPKRIELDGLNLTIAEWSVRTGIDKGTLAARLNAGWNAERILTQPSSRGWAWKNTHQLQLSKSASNA